MNTKILIAALAWAGLASVAHAASIDFSGYMRAGTGINARGGTQVCFGLPGADTKWRLGNECDYVIEPNLSAKLASFEGSDWHVHFMPSVYRAWGQVEAGTDELTTRFGQVYAYGTNIAGLANGKVWAGRRFYNRLQTGINDQFLEINDGDGAGIEDMDVGIGKLSIGFMLNGRGPANDNRYALPIRLTGLQTTPSGDLSIYVTPSGQLKSRDQTTGVDPADQDNGLAVGLYQRLNGVMGGNWLLGFRHDKQGELKNTRGIVQFGGKITAGTHLDVVGEYRVRKDAADAGNKWLALGARTDTHISGPFRVLLEVGHDQVKPDDGSGTRHMTKFTLAGAVSAGNEAWSRPTIRLFVTHAIWNEAARNALTDRLQQVYGDKKAGTSIGIQAETWW